MKRFILSLLVLPLAVAGWSLDLPWGVLGFVNRWVEVEESTGAQQLADLPGDVQSFYNDWNTVALGTTAQKRRELWNRRASNSFSAEERLIVQAMRRVDDHLSEPAQTMPVMSEDHVPITSEVLVAVEIVSNLGGRLEVTLLVYPVHVTLPAQLAKMAGDLSPILAFSDDLVSTGMYSHRWIRKNGNWRVERSVYVAISSR